MSLVRYDRRGRPAVTHAPAPLCPTRPYNGGRCGTVPPLRCFVWPPPPTRAGPRWLVPVEFINRALALVYDGRLDLRRPSHLLVVGDLRVPRVTIRNEPLGAAARLTIDATPRAASTITQDNQRLT